GSRRFPATFTRTVAGNGKYTCEVHHRRGRCSCGSAAYWPAQRRRRAGLLRVGSPSGSARVSSDWRMTLRQATCRSRPPRLRFRHRESAREATATSLFPTTRTAAGRGGNVDGMIGTCATGVCRAASQRCGNAPMQMTYDTMMRFADEWVAAWNRRDVDAVLAHYADDAQFVSPVASAVVGRPLLRAKQELAAHWRS